MCNFLHIAMGRLSLQHTSGICSRVPSISHEVEPVFAWPKVAATWQSPSLCRIAHECGRYTTSRECKAPVSSPIHTFGDLASLATATAHLTHWNRDRMSSPGWNGRNLPAQADVLGHLRKVFEEVAFLKAAPRIPCEARRSGFEAQYSSRLGCCHRRRSSFSRDHWLRQGQLDRRPHAYPNTNSNRLANTDTDTNAYAIANSHPDTNARITFGGSDLVAQFLLGSGQLQRLSSLNGVRALRKNRQRRGYKFYRFNRASRADIFLCLDRSQQFQRGERHHNTSVEHRTVADRQL